MIVFEPGDQITIDFKDIVDGNKAAFDPTTVKFHYKPPDQSVTTVTYPASGTSRIATGWYRLLISIPYSVTSVGIWRVDAQGLDGSSVSLLVEPIAFEVVSTGTL